MADIISTNNDVGSIAVEESAISGALAGAAGVWDAAEYGISREEVARRIATATTPEAREAVIRDLRARAIRRADLDTSTGEIAVFVAGEAAWHQLGKRIASAATAEEAIRLAVLDWTVNKEPMFLANGTKVPATFANVRSDTGAILGTVGSNYKVLQNSAAFAFMDGVVGEGLAMYETAGSLQGGKRIWMLASIPQEVRVKGTDDVVKPYALLTNRHDGTGSVRVLPTTVRVVCNNTLNLSLRGDSEGIRIWHNGNMKDRIAAAKATLGIVAARFVTFQEQIDALASISLKESEVTGYFETLYPTTRRKPAIISTDGAALLEGILSGHTQGREVVSDLLAANAEAEERELQRNKGILEQILANYENERNSLPGIKGTAWAAYNAVSEYQDHQAKYRGKDNRSRLEARMTSNFFGTSAAKKEEAFELALQMVSASQTVSA